LIGSARISGIIGLFQEGIGRGSGLPMGWKESIRNLKEEAG
jgi:hypothetical protein